MGQFLRINGDYNIKAADGSKITLDTGPASSGGEVRVTGNLIVEGDTTTVQAENLNVEDNIIIVNFGETGTGITLNYAGIQADRGLSDPVGIFYDETVDSWIFVKGGPAINEGDPATPFNFDESRIKVKEILTDSGTDSGDLTLIGTGTGVVKVTGTINYEDQVTNDDDIPNKKYVDDAIQNQPTFQIVAPQSQDTKVVIADSDVTPNLASQPGSNAYFTDTTGYQTKNSNTESAVSIIVDNQLVTQFYNNYQLIGESGSYGLEIDGANYEIRTETSITDQDIFIRTDNIGTIDPSDGSTTGTGKLRTNVALKLDKRSNVLTYESGFTLIYAKEAEIGNSGVWFSNDSLTESYRYGELISKNKALVFSMLF